MAESDEKFTISMRFLFLVENPKISGYNSLEAQSLKRNLSF